MGATEKRPVRADWVSKTLAGVLLGGIIAFAVSGVLSQLLQPMALSLRGQLAMWSVAPVWLAIASAVYFFASGRHAWAGLGAAAVLVHALWFGLRQFAG